MNELQKDFPLDLIQEIDRLWHPVYPYLAEEIFQLYGRQDGTVLEMGPFCGVIFYLIKKGIGNSFMMATFPSGMGQFFHKEAQKLGALHKVRILETDPSLQAVKEQRIDLLIFRGAFFFPSLFEVNYTAIDRVLKRDGMGLIGGGFGRRTPEEIRKRISEKSKTLNLQIGCFEGRVELISEGGLWVLLKK
jgi:hypothetical protein